MEDEVSVLPQLKEELHTARAERENKETQIEKIFSSAHAMAMEAQIARIELNQIFNTASDGMWIVDEAFNILKINLACCALLGVNKNEVIDKKCYELFKGSLCGNTVCPVVRIMKGEKYVECDMERVCGEEPRQFILSATPFRGLDGRAIGIVETFKDITERKKMETALQLANEELKRLSIVDGLTQVANRRRFDESLNEEWKRMMRAEKPLALIMCDIDFFKLYNDTYGHPTGDECLRAVAKIISASARRIGDLVARYGGEEFAVILPHCDAQSAARIAESIRKRVEELKIAHVASKAHSFVTLSLGVSSVVPKSNFTPKILIEKSDSALYEAKINGRNRVVINK